MEVLQGECWQFYITKGVSISGIKNCIREMFSMCEQKKDLTRDVM